MLEKNVRNHQPDNLWEMTHSMLVMLVITSPSSAPPTGPRSRNATVPATPLSTRARQPRRPRGVLENGSAADLLGVLSMRFPKCYGILWWFNGTNNGLTVTNSD